MARIYHKLAELNEMYEEITRPLKVTYKGTFSAGYLYWILREWLIENQWVGRPEDEFGETYYEQRESNLGTEIWIRWSLDKKSATIKPGDVHYKYELDIILHMMGMQDVEIVSEGKKVKANTAEIEIEIKPRMRFIGEWKGWLEKIKPWVFKKVYFTRWDEAKTEMIKESQTLQDFIKSYFEMTPGAHPEVEAFYLKRTEGKW